MEETNPTTAPTLSRPVMDVQPQRSVPQPVQRDATPVSVSRSEPTPEDPVVEPAPDMPETPPTAETPTPPVSDSTTPPIAGMQLPPKHKAPILAIIIAILVAGGLIGLTVYVYLSTQNPDQNTDTSTAQQESTADTATPEDVDSTSQSLETELNTANDDTDLNPNDLSDETLGL